MTLCKRCRVYARRLWMRRSSAIIRTSTAQQSHGVSSNSESLSRQRPSNRTDKFGKAKQLCVLKRYRLETTFPKSGLVMVGSAPAPRISVSSSVPTRVAEQNQVWVNFGVVQSGSSPPSLRVEEADAVATLRVGRELICGLGGFVDLAGRRTRSLTIGAGLSGRRPKV